MNEILLGITMLNTLGIAYAIYRLQKKDIKHDAAKILVDTSVLMDGRILSVAEAGFITAVLIVPRSVIGELQLLADGSDSDKRERARAGLDAVRTLQTMDNVTVDLLQDGANAREGVDNRLLALARKTGASICTLDYNLNKVALVEGVTVLNINELAKNLRMSYLPGEKVRIVPTQKGQDSKQGVGHLSDGTMVVIEDAARSLGKEIEVEFIRSLQTSAGRMMFAKMSTAATTPRNKMQSKTPKAQSDAQPKTRVQPQENNNSSRETDRKQKPAGRARRQQNTRRKSSADRESQLINLVENQ